MASILLNACKAVMFALVALSGIVSLYAAINAVAVYTDLDVFVSGLLAIAAAVLVGPLFCFFAAYGMIHYAGRAPAVAAVVVAPVLVAWCVNAVRLAAAYLKGGRRGG